MNTFINIDTKLQKKQISIAPNNLWLVLYVSCSVAEQPIQEKSVLLFYGYKYPLNIAQYNYPIYRSLIATRTLQSKHSHY